MKAGSICVFALAFFLVAGCAHHGDEGGESHRIDASQLPIGVHAIFRREFPGGEIVSAERVMFQKKLVAYTVIFRNSKGALMAVTIKPDGDVSRPVPWRE